jgi:hypothetical protein
LVPAEKVLQDHQVNLSNFINILYDPLREATYSIRTVIDPQGNRHAPGKIDTAFLIKIPAGGSQKNLKTQSQHFNDNIRLLLGGNFSDYIWKQILDENELDYFTKPLDWSKSFIADIRRREEHVQLDTIVPYRRLGFMDSVEQEDIERRPESVYYIHPFNPAAGSFERLLKTLMQGEQKMVLTATLTPTMLTGEEVTILQNQIAYCEGYKISHVESVRMQLNRASSLADALLRQYLVLQDAPFYLTFSAASDQPIDRMLQEYIGLAITEPVGQGIPQNYPVHNFSFHVGGYDVVVPLTEKDQHVAQRNLANLSQEPWNKTLLKPEKQRFRFLFDGNEAISAFYLPVNAFDDIPGIEIHHMEERPIPRSVQGLKSSGEPYIQLGVNHYFGFEQEVLIPEESRRQHTYIVGQTGTGKTTLLKTMILSDMKAGHGLAVIDPHGEMYYDLLEMIPEERKEDVVLFDPSDINYPIGFNLLQVKDEGDDEREYLVKELRAVIKRFALEFFQFSSGDYVGSVFFTHIQNNLLLAMSDQENPGTMLEFYEIFQSKDYWRRWLPLQWSNRSLGRWVEETLPKTDYTAFSRDGGRYGEYFSSKFVDFINDPRIALIFGQPFSTIDLDDVIENKKILLINLSKGLLGEANSNMLGMILMAKLNAAFMGRLKSIGEGEKPDPFYLYVDEFQNIATENFSILLAEARKFGLGLILANQYMQQISRSRILDAIIGNVGTIISFRLGLEDAKEIENQFLPEYSAHDLCNLPNYNAVMRTNIKGERTVPCNFKTVLTDGSVQFCDPSEVIKSSRELFGTPKVVAELMVNASLDDQRRLDFDLYMEDSGTPEDQLMCNNSLADLMGLRRDEDEQVVEQKISNEIRSKLLRYLLRSDKVDHHALVPIVEESKGLLFSNWQDLSYFIAEFMMPVMDEADIFMWGFFNATILRHIHDRYHNLEEMAESSEEKNELKYIRDLMEKDHWRSAGKNMKAMFEKFHAEGRDRSGFSRLPF